MPHLGTGGWIALAMLTGLYLASIYDVYLGSTGNLTITDSVRAWSSRWPVLPLSVGIIIGHLFWCSCPLPKTGE